MMLSIMSAAMPCPLGGSSYTVHPRYVVEMGVTHSTSYSARSAAVIVPPCVFELASNLAATLPV
jgi:hypothetical protein